MTRYVYYPIVKAKAAELKALSHLTSSIASRTLPIFEIDRPAESWPKYMTRSDTPIEAYLDRIIDEIASIGWLGPIMVDTYQWPPDAQTESGPNVISYVVAALRARGMSVIPVMGYDRWEDAAYRLAARNLPHGPHGRVAIRLDVFGIADAAEPDRLREVMEDILDATSTDPSACTVLMDFGDVSGAQQSVVGIFDEASAVVDSLDDFGFRNYSIAGCSLPPSIDQAVPDRDADAAVPRKEMVAWQMLRRRYPDVKIADGDYCVRGPTTTNAPVKHINGKIRYAIDRNHFVVRGHSRMLDGGFGQMYGLAGRLIESGHYLGSEFSWGDEQVELASESEGSCAPAAWIANDTNHHITHAVHEVLEFEQAFALERQTEGA